MIYSGADELGLDGRAQQLETALSFYIFSTYFFIAIYERVKSIDNSPVALVIVDRSDSPAAESLRRRCSFISLLPVVNRVIQ